MSHDTHQKVEAKNKSIGIYYYSVGMSCFSQIMWLFFFKRFYVIPSQVIATQLSELKVEHTETPKTLMTFPLMTTFIEMILIYGNVDK